MATPTLEQTSSHPYTLSAWSLDELLPDNNEADIQARLDDLERAVQAFESRRDDLDAAMPPSALISLLEQYETIWERLITLYAYGSLWFSADTQSSAALTFQNRMQQLSTDIQNRLLFFSLWWKGLSDEEAARLSPSTEENGDFHHYLSDLRRTRPFTLDEKSEQLINMKDSSGISAIVTLYTMLTNRLEFTLEVNGETKTLTRGEVRSFYYSPKPEMRAAAYRELYRVYGDEAKVLAQIYVNRVRDWHSENVQLRGYDSPLAVRNVANDLPDAAVEALLDACAQNAHLFHRYFKLKAQWLGMDKLRRYDIYAPLTESERELPYPQAVDMVLQSFAEFDGHVAEQAERVFADNHIDSEVRKGKRSGAFCSTVTPSLTPYVLMNYTGKVRDVATLAHELGHAIHSMMAEEHSILTQHAVLPLCETASVFAEMLLTDRLLERERDPLARRDLLATTIDDIYATVLRQAFFVRFERDAHAAILQNASPDELHALYLENLREQFGDSVDIADEFMYEWVSIPHIYHTPFYCYAYSFGQLLVLSLYRRYQQEGEAFKPGYFRMLAYGGSARPEQILREAGIDATDPAFWQQGFDVIRDLIDELEAIEL